MFTANLRITKRDGSIQLEVVVRAEKKQDLEHHAKMMLIGYSPFDYDVKITKEYEG